MGMVIVLLIKQRTEELPSSASTATPISMTTVDKSTEKNSQNSLINILRQLWAFKPIPLGIYWNFLQYFYKIFALLPKIGKK